MNKLFSELELEFSIGKNEKYKIKAIKNNIIYIKEIKKYLPSFYYLVF